MYRYPSPESGSKVNTIKQKFERNVSETETRVTNARFRRDVEEPGDSLRRSLSASPVKAKKNLRPNVARQLSNPSKNIKRTPAFRGEKPLRTRNLQSPTKERLVASIVDRNVKMFEEKPHCGKIGIVARNRIEEPEDARKISSKTNGTEDKVRTRVISRQKNISPVYSLDQRVAASNGKSQNCSDESERFFKNGAEYTRVKKTNGPSASDGNPSAEVDSRVFQDVGSQDPTLKAALQAPLPPGPPPKKPPRTFAHCRSGGKISASNSPEDKKSSEEGNATTDKEPTRDSKKMLEKLERVLVEHRSALGPRVIVPRNENNEISRGIGSSRTLDDSGKVRSQLRELNSRKYKVFDRTDGNSRFDNSIENSVPGFRRSPGSSEFHDDLTKSLTARRSSTELSSFFLNKTKLQPPRRTIEERVYAEPFAFDKNSGTDITGYGVSEPEERNYFSRSLEERRVTNSRGIESECPRDDKNSRPALHYMCTRIEPLVHEDNNNVADNYSASSNKIVRSAETIWSKESPHKTDNRGGTTEPDKCDKIKQARRLLNRAFGKTVTPANTGETPSDSNPSSDTDSLASSASLSDEMSSFSDKLRFLKSLESTPRPSKEELRRSLTEKRKNYVRRVSSKYSESREGSSLVDGRGKLFQVCLLVELDLSTREPYIKDKYPIWAKTPAWIENFCFPDASDWPPSSRSSQNQFYSLALMDEKGNRRYGYCCRVRPEDGPILPLAYCLITKYRASGFYRRVLLELQSRHGLPGKRRSKFIEELYNSPMPKPGQSLRVRNEISSSLCCSRIANCDERSELGSNDLISSRILDPSEKIVPRSTNDSDAMEEVVTRSDDPRLEERDMSQLLDAVSDKILVLLFASLLLERKVVLLCDKLSKLSSCVEALESLLYPFTWPHTFVPVLPDIPGLSEILEAPLPFIIGIFKAKNFPYTRVSSIQDGIVVDLDSSKIVSAMGDESSILPSRLQKKIRSALRLVSSDTKSGDGIRNFLVSEAFLRTFVETCSHYESHIVTQQDGKVIFQKDSFVKAATSKTEQYFLEWFVETTMFTTFVRGCIESVQSPGSCENDDVKLFRRRVAEFREGSEKSSQAIKSSAKKKSFGDLLKDLTHFHA